MLGSSLKAKWKARSQGRAKASFAEKTRKSVGKIWGSLKKPRSGSPLPTARPSSTSPQGSSSHLGPPHLQPSLSPPTSTPAASLHSSTSQVNAIILPLSAPEPSTPSLEPVPATTTSLSIETGEKSSSTGTIEEVSPTLDTENIVSPPDNEVLVLPSSTINVSPTPNSNRASVDSPAPSKPLGESSQSTTSPSSTSCHDLFTVTITAPLVGAVEGSSTASTETASPPPTTCPETASTLDDGQSSSHGPLSLDLWEEVFRNVNEETKEWIKQHGLNSTPNLDSNDQVKALIDLLQNRSLLNNKKMPTKISIGNQKIVLREYVADVVNFLTMAGDLAATLVPRETTAPWAAGKALLKIPVQRADQMAALAATIQWFTRIIRRGQVYERLYQAPTTDEQAVASLHSALVELYIAALEFLARSDKLIRSGKAGQSLEVLLRPQKTADFLSDLVKKEQKVQLEAQACELSRQAKAHEKLDEGLQSVLARLEGLSPPSTRIDEGVAKLLEEVDKDRLEKVMDFISSEKFGKGHAAIRDTRTPETGDWLIQHEGFRDWQAIPSSSTVLCLKGTVGTGKTYLTSRVIDHIRDSLENSAHDEGFAFYYCNRSGPSLQDPLTVLRSLARQLSYKAFSYGRIQKKVIQRYELALHEGRDFGHRDCRELILDSLNLYPRTTIILDALDESDITTYDLAEILIDLVEKAAKPVKLFISSRPDREYMDAFDSKSTITIDSSIQRGDIDKYLNERLYSTRSFKTRQGEIRELIQETFASQHGGMFRWVYLQLQSLKPCISDDAVRLWAKRIPPDLMGAYDQLWEAIRAQHNEYDIALAERAIRWVLCSFQPLTSEILLEAIRYAFDGNALVRKEKQSEQQILSLCQDLLTVDEQKQVWMLPHASVAEYFESKGMFLGTCDAFVARTSLNFTMKFEWTVRQKKDPFEPNTIVTFEEYAARKWPEHVQRYDKWLGSTGGMGREADLESLLKHFLGSPEDSSDHYRSWIDKIDSRWNRNTELIPNNMALFTMCWYGFYHVLRDWWHEDQINEELALQRCKDGHSSLVIAIRSDSMPICAYLLSVMDLSDPVVHEECCQAVRRAIPRGHKDIISLLMSKGKVNFKSHAEKAMRGHNLIELIIREKADMLPWALDQDWVDVDGDGGSALAAAAGGGKLQSVQILLDAGVEANAAIAEDSWFGSALAAAAWNANDHQLEIMQLLLAHGADPNLPVKNERYGSALEALIDYLGTYDASGALGFNLEADLPAATKTVELLLEAGADPAMLSAWGRHGSALAAAAWHGFKDLLALLIEATGKERARECLSRSRHPTSDYMSNDEGLGGWEQRLRETRDYLTVELGLGQDTFWQLGLWPLRPDNPFFTEYYAYES